MFRPKNKMLHRQLWLHDLGAVRCAMRLPPIQLIEIGNAYFIRDGHHRVSVAHALGMAAIDAEVIELGCVDARAEISPAAAGRSGRDRARAARRA